MNEIKTEGKVRDKVKDAKAFCRENNISEAQCHLLRDDNDSGIVDNVSGG